jgi:hypothetical protein
MNDELHEREANDVSRLQSKLSGSTSTRTVLIEAASAAAPASSPDTASTTISTSTTQ